MQTSKQSPLYSRRLTSRVETPEGVWVCWRCKERDDISRVRDLSVGGLYIVTQDSQPVGMRVEFEFLVQEGQIRGEAVVRHAEPGHGLGLKFTALIEKDSPHLAALLTRVRSLSRFNSGQAA